MGKKETMLVQGTSIVLYQEEKRILYQQMCKKYVTFWFAICYGQILAKQIGEKYVGSIKSWIHTDICSLPELAA